MAIYVAIATHIHCNSCICKPVNYIVFVASSFSKLSMHTTYMYVGAMYVVVSVPNGNPSFRNELAHCMHAHLKGKQEVAVKFECYHTKLHIYICNYVCIASTERR